jgi:lipoprotein-releasing system permease protein
MLRQLPHVVGAAPAILGKAMDQQRANPDFVNLTGIDPALEASVSDLKSALQTGTLDALNPSGDDSAGGILLGKDLARNLGVAVGDSVSVVTPEGTLSPMGMIPRARRLRVAGTFSLGLYELDTSTGFVALDVAKRLFGKGAGRPDPVALSTTSWRRRKSPGRSPRVWAIKYLATDWTEMNRSFFQALALEKIAMSLTIGLIMMVAALNIVASLILLVMEKHRDIAILKTMGANAKSVTAIFVMQGVIIGIIGTAVGATAGYVLASILDRYKLIKIPMDVYQVSHVPFKVLPFDLAMVVLAAVLVCLVATIYPSRQAARLDPAQALRYE